MTYLPPTGPKRTIVKLNTVTGVNGLSVAATTLYTGIVPAVITHVIVRGTAVNTVSVGPTIGFGTNSGGTPWTNWLPATICPTFNATNLAWVVNAPLATAVPVIQLADTFKVTITIGATATTLTLAFDVWGYYV